MNRVQRNHNHMNEAFRQRPRPRINITLCAFVQTFLICFMYWFMTRLHNRIDAGMIADVIFFVLVPAFFVCIYYTRYTEFCRWLILGIFYFCVIEVCFKARQRGF